MDVVRVPMIDELRAIRLQRGLSQAEVAQRLGTTQSAVARLEAGNSDPRVSTLLRYAQVVGLDIGRSEGAARVMPSLGSAAVGIRESLVRGDPSEAFRHVIQFLDEVDSAGPECRRWSTRDEPESVGDVRWDALLAGIAEYVANRYGHLVPGWAAAPGRFLDRGWFVIETLLGRPARGLAAWAMATSPPMLAAHGVFLDRASLVSV